MTTLAIGALPQNMPDCSKDLNLMPFHIEYSGLAPIGTYFRVKDASITGTQPIDDATTSSNPMVTVSVPEETPTSILIQTQIDERAMDVEPSAQAGASICDASPAPRATIKRSLKQRFVAAFRGRQIHGLKVDLPEGYGGMVLRGDIDGKTKSDTVFNLNDDKKKGKGRATSRKRKAAKEVLDVDDDMGEQEDNLHLSEPDSLGTLTPSATFNSFVLWNADIPVDERRDEYVRSLTEWVQLAAVIHGVEG